MAEYGEFARGGVHYPLTASLTNSILQDADPALYRALQFIAAAIRLTIGPRLTAEAAQVGLVIANAVAQTLDLEPSPFLLIPQFRFPTLAIWRQDDAEAARTLVHANDTSTWQFSYVLPSMTPVQATRLHPFLRAARMVIAHSVQQGWHPDYNGGEKVWQLAGIEQAKFVRASYGGYEPLEPDQKGFFRAVTGVIEVVERDMPVRSQFPNFDGADVTLDEQSAQGPSVTVTTFATHPSPTVTNIVPNSGTKAGGTAVTIIGTMFHAGQPARVWIGDVEATNVVVLSATTLQCVTPAHDAFPAFIADVTVENFSGQRGRLPAGFTFTAP